MTDCPTIIDLAALTAMAPPAPGADPFGADASILPVRAGPCEVFAASLAAGEGQFEEHRGDCWIMATAGDLVLRMRTQEFRVAQGSSAVIARGTAFSWHTPSPASLIAMRYLDAAEGPGGITLIDNQAQLSPSNPPADDVLISEKPSCRSNNHFSSEGGNFLCGIWDSTPYTRKPIFFRHSELMHLLAGKVTFTDASGRSATFEKGDTLIIEQGAECTWDSREHVAKIYAQYRPAS
ncbi:cupin domain-containing protein [Novosphingobium album (ex Hu et al. 2023)]|uniref:Cupin domain-containing protein n=1 Tax=Novosphingobium album (ex Hu et al. 2023) TaxID=2930093 RepID=A0ABT0B7B6_9SPHN|nr:cupin domain-containing protein [Novosphingobium album (ex Hu et al. 2023)]MCJ2180941.1 cupin domain-containing protein [Novosphingobium album (ex Hu et al. 2023)]